MTPARLALALASSLLFAACARREPASPEASGGATNAAAPAPAQSVGGASAGASADEGRGGAATAPPPAMPATTTATGSSGESPRAGSSNPLDDHGGGAMAAGANECRADGDCACGVDRGTGACAFGPASRIDTGRQCPDFCAGIDGRQHPVCDRGRCAMAR